jgi:hypothetical protein
MASDLSPEPSREIPRGDGSFGDVDSEGVSPSEIGALWLLGDGEPPDFSENDERRRKFAKFSMERRRATAVHDRLKIIDRRPEGADEFRCAHKSELEKLSGAAGNLADTPKNRELRAIIDGWSSECRGRPADTNCVLPREQLRSALRLTGELAREATRKSKDKGASDQLSKGIKFIAAFAALIKPPSGSDVLSPTGALALVIDVLAPGAGQVVRAVRVLQLGIEFINSLDEPDASSRKER